MRFLYEYRTKDNVRHSDVIDAPNRDAAFAMLKERGIKPGRVTEAPGFFNKLFGKGKRWLTIGVLAVICVSLVVAIRIVGADLRDAREEIDEIRDVADTFTATTRRQIIGDSVVIEKGIRTGWEDVFPEEGERFLASFSIPGVPAGLRNTTEAEIRAALARKVLPTADDSLEARQIKSIVEGMKDELRTFIAGGKHTIVEYGHRLVARQQQELAYYQRAKTEIESAAKSKMPRNELYALWESRNAQLRNIGVKLVALPEE